MSSVLETLRNVTTGTITTMLLEEGHPPLLDGGRHAARLFRQARGRPGLHAALRAGARGPGDAGKLVEADLHPRAIEAMPEGCVVVADAMGVTGAGIFGDILCMRMVKRGVTALITDGVMRDKHGVRRHRPAGLVRRRGGAGLASTSLPSSAGTSRSAAAAARSFPTTSSSPTTTARW